MTDIEQKARELANEVLNERGMAGRSYIDRDIYTHEALCRAIEQREATKQELSDYKQKVSDALLEYYGGYHNASGEPLERFIIPAPKPDPLVEALNESGVILAGPVAKDLRAALDARGLTITTLEKD